MRTIEETYNLLKDNQYFDYFPIKSQYENKDIPREILIEQYKEEKEKMQPYMIKYDNPFMHILHFEPKHFDAFHKGDSIVIQEKIDGSNAHFHISNGSFISYGNNYILNEHNHLCGFYYWVKENWKKVPRKYWNLNIYGEWLTPHHCEYPAQAYGQFYVFDIMDDFGNYLKQEDVEKIAKECGFLYAPILYHGEFTSWKDIVNYVGQTKLGGLKGEGIVVKNQTELNNSKIPFYAKIVDIEFQESNKARDKVKFIDMNEILKLEEEKLLVESIVTLARVRKIVLKLIDNGDLPFSWTNMDIEDTLKIVRGIVYQDCLREEPEIVKKLGKAFGKYHKQYVLQHLETLRG